MRSATVRGPWLMFTFVVSLGFAIAVATRIEIPPLATQTKPQTVPSTQTRLVQNHRNLPISFELNKGQTDLRVKFISRGSGYTLFLTGDEAALALRTPSPKRDSTLRARNSLGAKGKMAQAAVRGPLGKGAGPLLSMDNLKLAVSGSPARGSQRPSPSVLRMKLLGANPTAKVIGTEVLPGKSNYFIGNDPSKWRTDVPNYGKVQYKDIYSGVDLVYYGNQGELEQDFVVSPGADPAAIKFALEGADSVRIDEQGNLVAGLKSVGIVLNKPTVYQLVSGAQRRPVEGSFKLMAENRIGFEVRAYDRSRPLVIDPVLAYSTYFGGSDFDEAISMATDLLGNAYFAGATSSSDFPATSGAYDTTCGTDGYCNQSGDVFVTKLNPAGTAVIYSTYVGGSNDDFGTGIAVDRYGNAYVTGRTLSADFPTRRAIQPSFGGTPSGCVEWETEPCGDAFVFKVNARGSALGYATYLGGTGGDYAYGIAVDPFGQAYVTGNTNSLDFPLKRPFQMTCGGCALNSWWVTDAFVTKVNATGTAWIYSTYLGGSDSEDGEGIAADLLGNAYVTGYSSSPDFPVVRPMQHASSGAYVTKFGPGGSKLIYSTFLGGDTGGGTAIVADLLGNAYVTGAASCGLPTTSGAFQEICSGVESDAFVAKLNAIGSRFFYCTYLGGNGDEWGQAIAVDSRGNAYVTGKTSSTDFPVVKPIQASNGGGYDAFVTNLSATGSTVSFSTYLGGNAEDWGRGIGVDLFGSIYVAGRTQSTNFPTANPMKGTIGGGMDAFVAKIKQIAR